MNPHCPKVSVSSEHRLPLRGTFGADSTVAHPLSSNLMEPVHSRLTQFSCVLSHGDSIADNPISRCNVSSFHLTLQTSNSLTFVTTTREGKTCFESLSLGDGRLRRFHQFSSPPTASISVLDSSSSIMRRHDKRQTPHDSFRRGPLF